jgi:uncharacterized membrane protein
VTEGLVDHQILGIHHVHPGEGQLAWDTGYLALGLVGIAAGWISIHVGRRDTAARGGLGSAPVARVRS